MSDGVNPYEAPEASIVVALGAEPRRPPVYSAIALALLGPGRWFPSPGQSIVFLAILFRIGCAVSAWAGTGCCRACPALPGWVSHAHRPYPGVTSTVAYVAAGRLLWDSRGAHGLDPLCFRDWYDLPVLWLVMVPGV